MANVYLWYSKDSQAHFGEGEAGKSAMDTRAAYMFEVINEMYVNQRIKLEWNIVGSDFWDAPLSEDSLNHPYFPLWYSNGCVNYEEYVFETDECNEALNQRRVANDAAEADWHMVFMTSLENNNPKAPVAGVAGSKKDWDSDTNFLQLGKASMWFQALVRVTHQKNKKTWCQEVWLQRLNLFCGMTI